MDKKKIFIISILAIVIFVGLVFVRIKERKKESEAIKNAQPPLTAVSVMNPKKGMISEFFSTTGTLVSRNEVQLVPKVSGRLNFINVDEGMVVKAGQEIGEIDHSELDAQIIQAEAQLKIAKANLELQLAGPQNQQLIQAEAGVRQAESVLSQLKVNYEKAVLDFSRNQSLQAQGALPLNQVEASKTLVDSLKSQLQAAEQQIVSAKAAYQLLKDGTRKELIASVKAQTEQANAGINILKTQLENYRIVSPINGLITKRHVDPGNLVGPSGAIISISANSAPDLEMNVPEKYLLQIREGQKVDLETTTFPDKKITVTLNKISPVIDLQTRLIKVTGSVSSSLPLKIGMSFDCKIILKQQTDSLILPAEALIQQDGERLVYVSVNNKVESRKVKIGIENETQIEILSGISEKDQVIYKGNTFVKPGDKIQIKADVT